MLLSELRDRVLVESGNLFLADLSLLGINPSQFMTMVRSSLDAWSEYRFHTGKSTVTLDGTGLNLQSVHDKWVDYVNKVRAGQNPEPVPRLDVVPTFITDVRMHKYESYFDQTTMSYQYNKPHLSVMGASNQLVVIEWQSSFNISEVGQYDPAVGSYSKGASPGSTTMPTLGTWDPNRIPSLSQPREVAPSAPEDELIRWEVVGLESSGRVAEFIKLLTGKFMVTLGRSRRGFVLNDLPIQLDSDSLVSEGQQMIESATEQMQETSDVFDTILQTPVAGGGRWW